MAPEERLKESEAPPTVSVPECAVLLLAHVHLRGSDRTGKGEGRLRTIGR